MKETNEHIFKDSGRLAPFNARAPLELPSREPDFHAPPFNLNEKNLRRGDSSLLKAFSEGNKAERDELIKYRLLNFRLYRTLDLLRILSVLAPSTSKLCDFVLKTLTTNLTDTKQVLPGSVQLEMVKFLQAHIPSADDRSAEICKMIFEVISSITKLSLPKIEELAQTQPKLSTDTDSSSSEPIVETVKGSTTPAFDMDSKWKCASCSRENDGKLHTCIGCFVPRGISQPEFAVYLKKIKEEKEKVKLKPKEADESDKEPKDKEGGDTKGAISCENSQNDQKKAQKEYKTTEGKKYAKETEEHVFQSWTESSAQSSASQLLLWSMKDLVRTLINTNSPKWRDVIINQIRSCILELPNTLNELSSLGTKYESKSPLGQHIITPETWQRMHTAIATLNLLGGFGGTMHEGTFVNVKLTPHMAVLGYVKSVHPKFVVELETTPDFRDQTQEISCSSTCATPVPLSDSLPSASIFGKSLEQQRETLLRLLSATQNCLEKSSMKTGMLPKSTSSLLFKVCAQQLAVGSLNLVCNLCSFSAKDLMRPQLPCDLEMIMPLLLLARKNTFGDNSTALRTLPACWNSLMELGLRRESEDIFASNVRVCSYLTGSHKSKPEATLNDEKIIKPLILRHIDTLRNLGFSENMARAALAASNGDLGQAGAMLTDNQIHERDASSAWRTCLRRLDAEDAVDDWERKMANKTSTSKWTEEARKSPKDFHMGSDVLGKETDSDSGFIWSKESRKDPVGLIVKFRHFDNPVRNKKFALGQRVRAQDMHHRWYDAEIIEVKGDWVKLHYDKFDHYWDEWIDVKRQWRKLQVPGTKRLNAYVRTVDHRLPFELKSGVVWKVEENDPTMVLVKFPGNGFQPTHYIWADMHDLEPSDSAMLMASTTATDPNVQVCIFLRQLNQAQLSNSTFILHKTIKKLLTNQAGLSLSLLSHLRQRIQMPTTASIQLLMCLSNPWGWKEGGNCSTPSEKAKLQVVEIVRVLGMNLLENTIGKAEVGAQERVLKKRLEMSSVAMAKSVGDQADQYHDKSSWNHMVEELRVALEAELKRFASDCQPMNCEMKCQKNGTYLVLTKGPFPILMASFERSYSGKPAVCFYADKRKNVLLKKVSGCVPPPFAIRSPVYVSVDGCSNQEGLDFLNRMVRFSPLHDTSLDAISLLVEMIMYMVSHPWVTKNNDHVHSLHLLMAQILSFLLSTAKKLWGSNKITSPSMIKIQTLTLMSRLYIYQLSCKELPDVFVQCKGELLSGSLLDDILMQTALRYDTEIGSTKPSKGDLLAARPNGKLAKLLSRSNYLVKHIEFLLSTWEFLRRFDAKKFEQTLSCVSDEKKSDTPRKNNPSSKIQSESWPCKVCTYKNGNARTCCEMCGNPRPKVEAPKLPNKKEESKTGNSKHLKQMKTFVIYLLGTFMDQTKGKKPPTQQSDEKKDEEVVDTKAQKLADLAWRKQLKKNDLLNCMDTVGKWVPSIITATKGELVTVHYVGFDAKWDEWIARDSVRLRPRGSDEKNDVKSSKFDDKEFCNQIEAICLLDLSLSSIWWPLFSHLIKTRRTAEYDENISGVSPAHEYAFTPLKPLASLLFEKSVRLEVFDAIIRCSTAASRKLPDITVDTNNVIGKKPGTGSGLFGQIKKQFKRVSPVQLRGKLAEYSWATRWVGGRNQGAEGLPGPFQQSMGMIWRELSERAQRRDLTSPVVLCPNGDLEIGDKDRDKLLLNPNLKSVSALRCLGQLFGCILRSSSNCSLSFSRTVWKGLLYGHQRLLFHQSFLEKITELETFDKNQGRQLRRIIAQSRHDFCAAGYTYTTSLSSGQVVELFPGGHTQRVTYEDRLLYVDLVLTTRLEENVSQLNIVRQGFLSIIPRYSQLQIQSELSPTCYLLTCEELELRVCGSPDIDLELLKKKTVYKGASADSKIVKWFWNVLKNLSKKDQRRFIQFAWARSRLPHDMATNSNIKMLLNFTKKGSDNALPKAQTCFFLVDMPMYRSEELMRQKLCLALECDEINS